MLLLFVVVMIFFFFLWSFGLELFLFDLKLLIVYNLLASGGGEDDGVLFGMRPRLLRFCTVSTMVCSMFRNDMPMSFTIFELSTKTILPMLDLK
ncbi:hypothetical protein D3C80_1950990 [compost metagenome]